MFKNISIIIFYGSGSFPDPFCEYSVEHIYVPHVHRRNKNIQRGGKLMTQMGLDYQKLLESKRHNLATENVDARNATSNERNAASNESNASSNRLNADTNKFIASFKDREVKATESQASSAARNAASNEKNAESNSISAAAKSKDSETNRLRQQIDASLRDLRSKEIDNNYLTSILKYAPPSVQKVFAGTEVLGEDPDALVAVTGDTALSELKDWISVITQLFSLSPKKKKK